MSGRAPTRSKRKWKDELGLRSPHERLGSDGSTSPAQLLTLQSLYEDEEFTNSTRYPDAVTNMPGRIGNMPGRIRHYRRNKKNDEEMSSPTIDSDGTTTEGPQTDGHPINDGPIQMPATHTSGSSEDDEEEEEEPQMNIWATMVSSYSPLSCEMLTKLGRAHNSHSPRRRHRRIFGF